MDRGPDYIKERIRFVARRYGVPTKRAFFVEDAPKKHAELLQRIPANSQIGSPILTFSTDSDDWSVIGLSGIGGEVDGDWREARHKDINDLTGFLPDDVGNIPHKRDLDTLEAATPSGKVRFKAAPGEELFTLWNIELKAVRVSG